MKKIEKEYKKVKLEFRQEIKKAKSEKWMEMIREIDNDPWDIAYKLVMGKLRDYNTTPVILQLDEENRKRIIEGLFPSDTSKKTRKLMTEEIFKEENLPPIFIDELDEAVKQTTMKECAPGPSGIANKIWYITYPYVKELWCKVYNICLGTRCFPDK